MSTTSYCRSCKAPLDANAKFCPACGVSLAESVLAPAPTCVTCGTMLTPGGRFCRSCGAAVALASMAVQPDISPVAPPLIERVSAESAVPVETKVATRAAPRRSRQTDAPPVRVTPTKKQGTGKRLFVLALGILAVGLVWYGIDSSDSSLPSSPPLSDEVDGLDSAPVDSSPYPPASDGPYDVDGIEGIVDIDAPDRVQDFPTGVAPDFAAKLAELKAQARAGNTRAMTSLALTQRVGLDAQADPLAAIVLLQRAAAAGNADAMAALADEYQSGVWIEQDTRKAKSLRQQAAEAGSQVAQWELDL